MLTPEEMEEVNRLLHKADDEQRLTVFRGLDDFCPDCGREVFDGPCYCTRDD